MQSQEDDRKTVHVQGYFYITMVHDAKSNAQLKLVFIGVII